MNGNVQNISTPLMSCFEKMLDAEFKMYKFHNEINSLEYMHIETPELGLLDHALTLMGFPIDNSADFYDEKDPNCYDHPKCFCRDWLYEKWSEVTNQGKSVKEFILWAQVEARAF